MSTTNTISSNFMITGAHTESPKFFWKGVELTEIKTATIKVDSDGGNVRLRVQDTTTFDTQYAEMTATGIVVKKAGGN